MNCCDRLSSYSPSLDWRCSDSSVVSFIRSFGCSSSLPPPFDLTRADSNEQVPTLIVFLIASTFYHGRDDGQCILFHSLQFTEQTLLRFERAGP